MKSLTVYCGFHKLNAVLTAHINLLKSSLISSGTHCSKTGVYGVTYGVKNTDKNNISQPVYHKKSFLSNNEIN